ncbi:MAG: hypothetical protein ACOYWZ_10105 [Bacillota bacterium]
MFGIKREQRVRELFAVFKDKRIEQLEVDFSKDKRFLALAGRGDKLYSCLQKEIDDRLKADLSKYEGTNNDILLLAQSYFYEKGFSDCIKLIRILFSEDM